MMNYLNIGFYSAILICLELWAWNIFVFMSGFLGVIENSAQTAISTLMLNLYALAFGMNISTSAIVGMELGREKPEQAKNNGKVAQIYGIFQSLLLAFLLWLTGGGIATLFSPIIEI